MNLPVWPGNGGILVPPAGGSEGDVEAENEGERDHLDEIGTVEDHSFVDTDKH